MIRGDKWQATIIVHIRVPESNKLQVMSAHQPAAGERKKSSDETIWHCERNAAGQWTELAVAQQPLGLEANCARETSLGSDGELGRRVKDYAYCNVNHLQSKGGLHFANLSLSFQESRPL